MGSKIQVLKLPLDASELLVKASLLLRLRKNTEASAERDSKIAAQNLQLRDLTNRFKHELKEAQTIQQSIMPDSLPGCDKATFAASYIPLEAVGGDLYDIWVISPGVYGIFIGDVTGHGLSAAFLSAMTKMSLAYAPKDSPESMLYHMNEGLVDYMPDGRFVTVAAAIYHSETGKLSVGRGGHPPPVIWRAEKNTVEELVPDGFALGMVAGMDYELFETVLEIGDKFMMVTDGIMETTDMDGNMIGSDGLANYFGSVAPENDIAECISKILDFQSDFCGGRILKDDNTVVALERTG